MNGLRGWFRRWKDVALFGVLAAVAAAALFLMQDVPVRSARPDDSVWRPANWLPDAFGHAPAVVAGNHIYVTGGDGTYGDHPRTSVYYAFIYSSGDLNYWSLTTPLPAPRHYHAGVEARGYLYIIGGYDLTSELSTVLYAPINANGSLGSWRSGRSLPGARAGVRAVQAKDFIYVIGGTSGGVARNSVFYAYVNSDGSLGNWIAAPSLPRALGWTGVAVANDVIYVTGGHDGSVRVSDVYRARINANGSLSSWQAQPSLPVDLANHTLSALGGYLYTFGGLRSTGYSLSTIYRATLAYDGTVGSWDMVESMPQPLHDHGAAVKGWRAYTVGGYTYTSATNAYQARVEIFTPKTVHFANPVCGRFFTGASASHWPYFMPDGSTEPWYIDASLTSQVGFQDGGYSRLGNVDLIPYAMGYVDGYANVSRMTGGYWLEAVSSCGGVTATDTPTPTATATETATPTATPTATRWPGQGAARIVLPLVLRQAPGGLAAPVLNAITPPEDDPAYTVRWSAVAGATSYVLEQATNPDFSFATQVYAGTATEYLAPSAGTLINSYRVKARGAPGDSAWSNTQSVEISWELEPNNTLDQGANGPLAPAKNYYGYPNDPSDYFYLYVGREGQMTLKLQGHGGQGVQTIVYDGPPPQDPNPVVCAGSPDCETTFPVRAGFHYVKIYTESGFNSASPYSLQVTFP